MRSAKLTLSVGLFVALVVASCTSESVFPLGGGEHEIAMLDLARPEVRDHLCRWAARGLACERLAWRCDECGAIGDGDDQCFEFCAEDDIKPRFNPADHDDAECWRCNGTGYLRAPCSIEWARDNPPALAWSLKRLQAGLPVLGAVGTWEARAPTWTRWRTPSPRRTTREKASITLNPSLHGRATSKRQFELPRSMAA